MSEPMSIHWSTCNLCGESHNPSQHCLVHVVGRLEAERDYWKEQALTCQECGKRLETKEQLLTHLDGGCYIIPYSQVEKRAEAAEARVRELEDRIVAMGGSITKLL